ncbi:Hypothetical_protein [Hexamita inflata]|uniref:Hypothetical_protein n=1 Tax=Hexamita inflata TaxID=28002 RepID=A0AA86P1L8_9EUKA|nr:Hypothetical protein HINF_LOCUS17090 [Hexamita inflata]
MYSSSKFQDKRARQTGGRSSIAQKTIYRRQSQSKFRVELRQISGYPAECRSKYILVIINEIGTATFACGLAQLSSLRGGIIGSRRIGSLRFSFCTCGPLIDCALNFGPSEYSVK